MLLTGTGEICNRAFKGTHFFTGGQAPTDKRAQARLPQETEEELKKGAPHNGMKKQKSGKKELCFGFVRWKDLAWREAVGKERVRQEETRV